MKSRFRFSILMIFLLSALHCMAVTPVQPDQAATGPGSYDYRHGSVWNVRIGVYEDKFFLFEPIRPMPQKAPVVIFLHGWLYAHPNYYQAWIEHLTMRGNIVIFPCYQGFSEPAEDYFAYTIRSVKDALIRLVDGTHVEPDWNKVSIIGHECGGVVAANYAATAKFFRLPTPKAVMILMPSRGPGANLSQRLKLYDLSKIPQETLMLVLVGDDDTHNEYKTALDIFYGADFVATRNKDFLTLISDIHGVPALIADRFAPYCPVNGLFSREVERRRYEFIKLYREKWFASGVRCHAVDAHDWFGFWRLFDSLSGAAFGREKRSLALGETMEQCFMGTWSDGRPVRRLLSTKRP